LGKLQGQLAGGWITRVEVEVIGEGLRKMIRPVTAVLLAGMLLPVDGRPVNWISAPLLAYEQKIDMSQAKSLIEQDYYPNLIACAAREGGSRTVAGVGNGEAGSSNTTGSR
jgi:D-3-phosphoglycerate dehydrogenase